MKKLIIVTSILFIAVIAAAVFYFSNIHKDNRDQGKLLNHIPEDALFISSFQNDKSFFDIFSDYEAVNSLLGKENENRLSYLYEHFLQSDAFGELLARQRIYLSFHPQSGDSLDWLISIPFAQKTSTKEATSLLTKIENISLSDVDSIPNCFNVTLKNFGGDLYIGFRQDAAVLSFSKELVVASLDENAAHLSPHLVEKIQTNRQKAASNLLTLYLNQGQLLPTIQQMMSRKTGNVLNILKGWKGMTSLNLNYKSDAIMFSGPSDLDSARNMYLGLFAQQQAVPQTIKRAAPENTASFVSFALSDYTLFHAGLVQLLKNRKQLDGMNQQFAHIRTNQKVDIDSTFIPLWDNEFAYLELNTREQIGILKIKDRATFDSIIPHLSTSLQDSIYRMDNSNLLYYSFGDPLVDFQRPYFIVLDDYYICANTQSTLQHYRQNYRQHKLLGTMAEYIEFDNMQAHKANISFFLHNANAGNNLRRNLKSNVFKRYDNEDDYGFKRFYGLSIQLSGYNGAFFTNLYAKYIPSDQQAKKTVWDFNVNGPLSVPPAVLQYNDTSKFILAQTDNGQLYALNNNGKQLWRATLSGPALGQIQQLADRSIVLTTKEKLYRFWADGKPLPGFPVELKPAASYGATIVEQGEELRIYIPAGEHILAYDGKGQTLDGWRDKTVSGNILFDLKTATLADVKYVIAMTDIGKAYFFNFNGGLVGLNEDATGAHFNNRFGLELVDNDPSRSRVITSDTSGNIKSFFFDNKQLRKRIASWGSTHFFDAQNIAGDSIPEFVVLDRRHLYVYNNADSSLIYDHSFNQDITDRPQFFAQNNKRQLVGIASGSERLLYLFEEDGSPVKGFPVNGLPNFYFGRLKNDGGRYLLCATNERTLSAYRF
ncbi:PQQ-binding-like beta-propeller repeat protein [Olivibacter sitiensis]|uniref:outer membrane protein assembly factor BamB family protein n=1 Tax=Olivibacter sitiensis TaxID=376470 RepID=UPI00146FB759|nr:PQQ-binding-like beta-propeller repeat protein [Olivibacter sitiensis]